MKVLQVNKYLYPVGGPETLMFQTAALLESHGHSVSYFGMAEGAVVPEQWRPYLAPGIDYDRVGRAPGWPAKARAAINLIYSRRAARGIARLIADTPPDVVHFRNIYHQLSPSVLRPVRRRGIPSVLSVHDYKLVCPNYRLYTHDGVCRRCVPGRYHEAVVHKCVKDSRVKSLLNAVEMYIHHSVLDIYGRNVDALITENRFMRGLLVEAGFDERKIHVVPNFVDIAAYQPSYDLSDYILFFGRLVPEKGVVTLIDALQGLPLTLVIVGDGPQRQLLEAKVSAQRMSNVTFLGSKWGAELAAVVRGARFTVVPSEWLENSPMALYQSAAWGKPIIGARVGGIPDLIEDGTTGLLFDAGQVGQLRDAVLRLSAPGAAEEMGRAARHKAEQEFSPGVYYDRLMQVYDAARRFRSA